MHYKSLLSTLLPFSVSLASTLALPVIASAGDDDKEANQQEILAFLTHINDETRKEFQKAWHISGGGVGEVEGVVLLFQMRDGSLQARSLGQTNERRRFSFAWHPGIKAVVHTHPNSCNAKPAGEDMRIADRFGIPVCTITNRGMFVYDPATRKTTKLHDGLDWLNPSKPDSIVAKRRGVSNRRSL